MSLDLIFSHKKEVDLRLVDFLSEKEKQLTAVNAWSHDVMDRLRRFVTTGKTVRGSLVMYTYALNHPLDSFVADAAAAIELFHSGFLIHDDIMDKDEMRHGYPTIHKQYEQIIKEAHFGSSMAINIGDLCFFLAYELIGSLQADYKNLLISYLSRELEQVTLAQIQDIIGSHLSEKMTKAQILNVYRYKTARYTFSLPMWFGAALSGMDGSKIELLVEFGEKIGLLYQIRDDELNELGNRRKDSENNTQTLRSFDKNMSNTIELKASLVNDAQIILHKIDLPQQQKMPLYELITFCDSRIK